MICLTFDTDHMSDQRMSEFLSAIHIEGEATFFCSCKYSALDGSRHEICPHPLLEPGGDWEEELEAKRNEFPGAIGWRSHSCIFSHMLAIRLVNDGYRYVSTHDHIGMKGIMPHKHSWGLWQMPIYYMDNLDFSHNRFWKEAKREPFSRSIIDTALGDEGVYVFDFHPIHLLLNTTSTEAYFQRRDHFLAGEEVMGLKCREYGVRDFFEDLTDAMISKNAGSVQMQHALDQVHIDRTAM